MGVLSSEEGTGNIPYQRAHLSDTRGPTTIVACAILSALSTLAVFLRVLVRRRTKSKFEADDYTIFITLVCRFKVWRLSLNMPQVFAWASFVSVYYGMIFILMLKVESLW